MTGTALPPPPPQAARRMEPHPTASAGRGYRRTALREMLSHQVMRSFSAVGRELLFAGESLQA